MITFDIPFVLWYEKEGFQEQYHEKLARYFSVLAVICYMTGGLAKHNVFTMQMVRVVGFSAYGYSISITTIIFLL